MSGAAGKAAAPMSFTVKAEKAIRVVGLGLAFVWLLVAVVLPLTQVVGRSFLDGGGAFVGLANYKAYVQSPALFVSFTNSLTVAAFTTVISVGLAFGYSYALTRAVLPMAGLFRTVAMLPLFAPTLLHGIALVYLFGNKGLITTGLFGWTEKALGLAGVDIGLYGPTGVVMAEVLFTFPQAVLILTAALSNTDARLYEASSILGAAPLRTFFTVTLPGVRYGLLGACFVCFTLSFTDFGAPKVVGGNYSVLATEIYKQVIGQQNFTMGSTVSVALLIPTVLAFILDRWVQRRQSSAIGAKAVMLTPKPEPLRDRPMLVFCLLVAGAIVVIGATALFASLVKVWPYDLSLVLDNYRFRGTGGGGYAALKNSVLMAVLTAVFGTTVTFISAYLLEKSKGLHHLRQGTYFLSMLPLALPGLVVGLAYIFFFNKASWLLPGGAEVPNPFSFLYGTMTILVICNIAHFYTVAFLTATTALKQLDHEFEAVSDSMGVPFWTTFWRVTVPVSLPAILEVALFYFVNALATVSAIIFLYTADIPLASVAVVNMDDAGDTAPAAAMCVLIVATSVVVRALFTLVTRGVLKRSSVWRAR